LNTTTPLTRITPFLGAKTDPAGARLVLFGCPFDSTCSFRPGTRFGPPAIRAVSDVLESYCPVINRDLEDVAYYDAGDLILPPGDTQATLEIIYNFAGTVRANGQIPAGLGGEHLLSLPLIQSAYEANREIVIVHFDAHMDMRNDYLGVRYSHASFLRRVTEFIPESRILHIGVRSGIREEFEQVKLLGNLLPADATVLQIRQWIGDNPIYVTVDLDVMDPSIFPGTGTPEPGGVNFITLQNWLVGLADCRWVGWDVMELSPSHDPSEVSSIVAAKIVRTMILASSVSF
jgi:agmatinase